MSDAQPALTQPQSQILGYIKGYVAENGFPPSCIDILKHMGYSSPNAVHCHLVRLEAKGAIVRAPGIARGIRVTGKY